MGYPFQVNTYDQYQQAYQKSIQDPEGFWADVAGTFSWRKKWDKVLEWDFKKPDVKWFINGRLNITENCLDRHLSAIGNKPALIWEPNDPKEKHTVITYNELLFKVNQFAQVLRNNGVKKGDRI